MRQLTMLFSLATVLLTAAAVAEPIPPYLPPAHQFKRVETKPLETAAVLAPDGTTRQTLGDFSAGRSLNGVWKCSGLEISADPIAEDPSLNSRYAAPGFHDASWDDIPVPLNWYLKYPEKQRSDQPCVRGYYRTQFQLDGAELAGHRVILSFDMVGYDAKVFVNGVEVGNHHGDFTGFKLDVTGAVKPGDNILALRVFSDHGNIHGRNQPARHTYGSQWSIDNIKGGIWHNVTLSIEPLLYIDRLTVVPDLANESLHVDCRIDNLTGDVVNVDLAGLVTSAEKNASGSPVGIVEKKSVRLSPGVNQTTITVKLDNPAKWSVDSPRLYFFTLGLRENGKTVSAAGVRFGYREFHVKEGKFFLNGEQRFLFGENISSVLYGGKGRTPAEEDKMIEQKLLDLRNSGYVIVRTPHMPIIKEALDIADECGMMIFNEWSWCFSSNIDPVEFPGRNKVELEEFFHETGNHPSVVMWSLGNETSHRGLPHVQNEMNRQVAQIRALDKQKRPISVFSGAASWWGYGETKLDTDLHDLHLYTSLSGPWTEMPDDLAKQYETALRIYEEKDLLSRPLYLGECIGFSWGVREDAGFRRGNLEDYTKYVGQPTTWGNPCGIGFSGVAPLFKALGPGFTEWVQSLYGRRILEIIRLNAHFTGFAPWFERVHLPAALLWNQPVFPALHADNFLRPRNFFATETTSWNLAVVNSGNDDWDALDFDVEMVAEQDGRSTPVAAWKIDAIPAQSRYSRKVDLRIPALAPGFYQMRATLRRNDLVIGQNYYDTYVQTPEIRSRKIDAKKTVYVLDTGAAGNVAELESVLKGFGIDSKRVAKVGEIAEAALLIVPAEFPEPQTLRWKDSAEVTHFLRNIGGTLLVLEQTDYRSELPGNQMVSVKKNPFVDLVFPEHPIFNGLDYRSFDTWNNPDHGYVIYGSFLPFNRNAIAVKGPILGFQDVGTAILEATDGKGRLLLSQLAATANRNIDSAAATYLYNLIDYAAGDMYWQGAQPLADAEDRDYSALETRLVPIDLSTCANVSFQDDIDNDGKGGWTDQGENDFRVMPLGIQKAAGISFRILDPDRNHGKSCLAVRGTQRPGFPAAIRDIPVGGRFSRLFFMHTAAWNSGAKAGCYRIHYADGSSVDCDISGNRNIGDWWTVSQLSEAKVGIVCRNAGGHEIGTFVTEWENPKPELEIRTIDFLSAAEARGNQVDYMPSGTPVPVLVAVTGEKVGARLEFTGKRLRGASGVAEIGTKIAARTSIRKEGERNQIDILFPASVSGQAPVAIIAFDAAGGEADYGYLTFTAKSDESGVIQLVLPTMDWKGRLIGEVAVKGDNQPHKYRLMIGKEFRKDGNFNFAELRGEFFLYYRSERAPDQVRPELKMTVSEIALE